MEHAKTQRLMDRLAIVASSFCLVHCLLTPILLIAIPVLASTFVADQQFHRMLLMFVLPTSTVGLVLGCRRHKDWRVLVLGLLGLSLLVLTAALGHEAFGEIGEKFVTVAGSVTLATGHIRNRRLCRKDRCET